MRRFRPFIPLQLKFIFLFALMITIPFLISGIITYHRYIEQTEHDSIEYTNELIGQISINLDRYLKEMERITLAPFHDPGVMEILHAHNGPLRGDSYVPWEETSRVQIMISSLAIERTELEGIFLFANDGTVFSNLEHTVSKRWMWDEYEWMDKARKKEGALTILVPHEVSYYLDRDKKVASIARMLIDPYTRKPIGFVKVDLTTVGFEKILSSLGSQGRSGKYYVTDELGEILYPFTESALPFMGDANHVVLDDRSYLVARKTSPSTALTVNGLVPQDMLRMKAKDLVHFTMYISIFSLLFAYAASVFTSNHLVKPIRHLQRVMKRIQRGDFSERATVKTDGELAQLTEGFNLMMSEIQRLVKEVYEIRIREKEAELRALVNQMNPHFLYNTLESFSMMAIQQGNADLSSAITSLGKLLRYTVDHRESAVYLREEIEFVESYLQLHTVRLGDKLQVDIQIDVSHEYCLVPKLVLQPFIENAIEHALTSKPLTIKIRSRSEGEDLLLIVEDDGAGMTGERRLLMEKRLGEPEELAIKKGERRSKGYGLRNVHQRLRLLYGESSGIVIHRTAPAGGTEFHVRMPFRWEEA